MNICFEVSGYFIDAGLESQHGTEGRWAFEWARLLAAKGHRCDLLVAGSYSVGGYSFPPNINVVSGVLDKEYDIFFIVGEIKPWHKDVRTKLSISLVYSNPGNNELERILFSKPNHIIGAQTERMKKFCVEESSPFYNKTYNIPTPIAEKFSPSCFGNNYYLLPHRYQMHDKYLYAMIYFLKKYKPKLGALHKYWVKPQLGPRRVGNQNVLSIFDELQVDYYDTMPKMEADRLLHRARFVFTSGARGGIYSIEAVINGVLPFPTDSTEFYFKKANDILYPEFNEKTNSGNNELDAQSICEIWELPYSDVNFYNKALNMYQESVSYHLYDNAYNIFLNTVKGFL